MKKAGDEMTGRLQLKNAAEFSIRMQTDTSNYRRGIIWNNVASDTRIAEIGYQNTVQRIFLNPLGSTEVWSDVAGKYSFIIGNNFLTYNTWTILHSNNSTNYASGSVKVANTSADNINNTNRTGSSRVNFFDIYSLGSTMPATYGNIMEICSTLSRHWQPQLYFSSGKGGHIYYRNKDYNISGFGSWKQLIDSENYSSILNSTYVKKAGDTMTGNLVVGTTSTFSGKATFNGGLSGTLTGSLSGNATTATTLQTSRTINGTSFNGSANITTSYWGTTRTIWGQSVNGSANVSGAMTGVTSITATGLIRTSNLFSAGDGGSDNAYGYYNCTRPNTANTGYVCYAFVRSGTYAFGLGYYNNEIVLSSANTSRQFNARWLQLNSSRLLINGNIEATGAVTAKSSSSDIRLKKNIKEYNALDIINKLKSVKYYWNDTAKANSPIFNDNEEHYGLIAQDLLINGYSQWVSNCFKDYYVIQYERLIPVLWRGIQQVDNEVATLKKKIATLEKELSSVKRQLSL